jgi:serine/threonine-protein kinase HipA
MKWSWCYTMWITNAGLEQKVIENIFKKYKKLLPKWGKFIDESFLPEPMKNENKNLISKKSIQIEP